MISKCNRIEIDEWEVVVKILHVIHSFSLLLICLFLTYNILTAVKRICNSDLIQLILIILEYFS